MVVLAEPLGSTFLVLTADFSNHNDTLGLWVVHEAFKNVNKVSAFEGISANSDNGRLAQPVLRCLVDSLISQGAGTRHNSNLSLVVDVARHDSNPAFFGLDDAGAVRSNQASFALGSDD